MLSLIGPHSDLTMLLLWNYPLWILHEEGCPQGDMCSNFGTEVTKLKNIIYMVLLSHHLCKAI